jgi:hypothetical protein
MLVGLPLQDCNTRCGGDLAFANEPSDRCLLGFGEDVPTIAKMLTEGKPSSGSHFRQISLVTGIRIVQSRQSGIRHSNNDDGAIYPKAHC